MAPVYEIAQIMGVGNTDDLMLTIRHWDSSQDRTAGKTPAFVEEHLVIGLPLSATSPATNETGMMFGASGELVSPWQIVDGQWAQVAPPNVRRTTVDLDPGALLAQAIDTHAAKGRQGRSGFDTFNAGQYARVRFDRRGVVMHPRIKALVGKERKPK